MTAPGSWRRYPLEVRAKLSAERQDQSRWPRRWILFGPRVVPLETFLLSQARTHRRHDKARKHWQVTVENLMRGKRRRDVSLAKAHAYIQDLKARLNP